MASHPITANGLPRAPVTLESRVDASDVLLEGSQSSSASFPGPSPTPSPAAVAPTPVVASEKQPTTSILSKSVKDDNTVSLGSTSDSKVIETRLELKEPKIEPASTEPITELGSKQAAPEPVATEPRPLIRLKLNAEPPAKAKKQTTKSPATTPKRKSARAKAAATSTTASPAKAGKGKSPAKPSGRSGTKPTPKKKLPKPKMIVSLRYANKSPLPDFEPVEWETPKHLFWTRVSLREFFLRFDKLCRLPTRHTSALNDPFHAWNDMLYKAAIVALLRLVKNDSQPIIPYGGHYLGEIEHTPADSPTIWQLLYELLEQCDPYLHKVDDMSGDMYRLELVRRLMVFCTGTETIRITVVSDIDEVKQLQLETVEKVKAIHARYAETSNKLEKLRATDERLYEDRLAAAQRSADDRIFKVEQASFFDVRKYNTRTEPLGRDTLGNIYWCFQQKTKDASWGRLIFCEMVWPIEHFEQTQKVLQDEVDEMVKPAVKRRKKADVKTEGFVSELGVPSQQTSGSAPQDAQAAPKDESRKRKRKRVVPTPPAEKTCYYVSGRADIYQLAAWIKAQPGHSNKKLVDDLESLAYFWQE